MGPLSRPPPPLDAPMLSALLPKIYLNFIIPQSSGFVNLIYKKSNDLCMFKLIINFSPRIQKAVYYAM